MLDIMIITVVQIIIEALPISSSGHVLLAQLLWQKYAAYPLAQLPDFFDHFLHGPTVVILLVVFFKDWFWSVRRLLGARYSVLFVQRPMRWSERRLSGLFFKIFGLVCAADAVTALAYGVQHLVGKDVAFFHNEYALLGGFFVTMMLLLSLLVVDRQKVLWGGAGGNGPLINNISSHSLTIKKTIILGTVQGVALLCHGVSRFGSTYVIGRWLGLSPRRAFQFSFLMQFPLIAAAFVINGVRGMLKQGGAGISDFFNLPMTATMFGATLIAGFVFAGVYKLALRRRLWWFGVYMFVPICLLIIALIR